MHLWCCLVSTAKPNLLWCCDVCLPTRRRDRYWRPRTPGDDFLDLSSTEMLVLRLPGCCHRRLAERRGMRASPQQTARCRHMCHERVRERESLVPESERVMALARGAPRALPSVDTRCSATPYWIVARARACSVIASNTANTLSSAVYVHLSAQ